MENCEKHSKKICAYCKHYDYCARVNRCDGRCYVCGINEFENNTSYKEQMTNKIKIVIGSWGSYSAFMGIVQRLQFAGARFFPYQFV